MTATRTRAPSSHHIPATACSHNEEALAAPMLPGKGRVSCSRSMKVAPTKHTKSNKWRTRAGEWSQRDIADDDESKNQTQVTERKSLCCRL